jgi:signal transduction histidine kinase
MNVEPEAVALRPLIEGAASFFAVSAAEKQLQLTVRDWPPDLPDTVLADELRLKQILNNLLSNAFKFTGDGSVTVRVRCAPDGAGAVPGTVPGTVVFDVLDTGPGIPASLQGVIFEKFRQANDRVSYQHGGTGLGLALVQGPGRTHERHPERAVGGGSRRLLHLAVADGLTRRPRGFRARSVRSATRWPAHSA